MERVFDGLAERFVDSLREQAVEPRALVHLVEVHERLALPEHAARTLGGHRRPLRVVEHAFHEVTGRQQVLEPLLILDADEITAEAVGDAQCGDVHLALQEHLGPGEVAGLVLAEAEGHARLLEPLQYLPGLGVAHPHGLVVKRTLAKPLLEDTRRVEQMIGDDRVEHPHAALVEHSHEGFLVPQFGGDRGSGLGERPRDRHVREWHDVAGVVVHAAGVEPRLEVAAKRRAREVISPERVVGHARLRERAVEIEHPHETRPLSRPVGDGEDRPRVRGEAGKHVVGILPHGFGHDERRLGVDRGEHVEPFAGTGDEAVAART